MAGALGSATFSFLRPPFIVPSLFTSSTTNHRRRLRPFIVYSVSSARPRRPIKRTNHLRPKIITKTSPTTPVPYIEAPEPVVAHSPLNGDGDIAGFGAGEIFPVEQNNKVDDFVGTETVNNSEAYKGLVGRLSARCVLKYGSYLVGLFVFQTICTVWVLRSANSRDKNGNLGDLVEEDSALLNDNGRLVSNLSNVSDFSESEVEQRIHEIRAMAREARERESSERMMGDKDSEIEKEIDARLVKLEKKLNSEREKLPVSFMDYLGLFGDEGDRIGEDGVDLKDEKEMLVFKKKLKFRSPPKNMSSSPEGFSGLIRRYLSDDSEQNDNHSKGTNVGMQATAGQNEKFIGDVQKTSQERSSEEDVKGWKPQDFKKQYLQHLTQKSQGSAPLDKKPVSFSRNRSRETRKRTVAEKHSDEKADLWWSNLPYVLGVLMRRGPIHEAQGLFALKMPSLLDGEDSAYTLAFEDRVDANNFCYLLDAFFHELDDFNADIVPLSVTELTSRKMIGSAKLIDGLYYLVDDYLKNKEALVSSSIRSTLAKEQILLWHNRLGHPNFSYLKRLLPHLFKFVDYLKLHCEQCTLSKSHKISYPTKPYQPSKPLYLIHSDVWGPSRVKTLTWKKWFVTFIDDHTQLCWVYLICKKFEVAQIFQNFYTMVETQFYTCIGIFHSDNDIEYFNKVLGKFLKSKGIVHQSTFVNTPQQHGITGRKNKHLLEVARSIMFTMNVSRYLWGEAVLTAS
ncbi:hypothetical protein K2173_007832 [Erythroxylum novogranatense]|uniref:Integrase catalytic domain-containing protein n=1 Tax=Erythroxylum novogranatense TaxID=1862640 RepID=A0AAV8TIT7_9ROSI|nr:hypothetical protein K2173_007832 [Erythroxylum novogranatense]